MTGALAINGNNLILSMPKTNAFCMGVFLLKLLEKNVDNEKLILEINHILKNPKITDQYIIGKIIEQHLTTEEFKEAIKKIMKTNVDKNKLIKKINRKINKEKITSNKILNHKRKNFIELIENDISAKLLEEEQLHVIRDNYKSHITTHIKNAAKILNIDIMQLPTYSPEFNPIEEIWRIKSDIAPIPIQTKEELIKIFIEKFHQKAENQAYTNTWINTYLTTENNHNNSTIHINNSL